MLRAPEGANIEAIMAATGWQSHTVRGAMAGALKKKLGLEVTSEKVENRGRVYKLPAGLTQPIQIMPSSTAVPPGAAVSHCIDSRSRAAACRMSCAIRGSQV